MTNDSRWSWWQMIKRITWRHVAPLYWLPLPSAIFTKWTTHLPSPSDRRLSIMHPPDCAAISKIHLIAKSKWLRRMDVCTRRHALLLNAIIRDDQSVARDSWTKAADTSKLWEKLFFPSLSIYTTKTYLDEYTFLRGSTPPIFHE